MFCIPFLTKYWSSERSSDPDLGTSSAPSIFRGKGDISEVAFCSTGFGALGGKAGQEILCLVMPAAGALSSVLSRE
jgi:hypothetical protein